MNTRERLMLIAAIVLLGAVCFKFVIYDPHEAAYTQLVQARDAAGAELRRNQQIMARSDQVHQEYNRLTAFIATVEAKLPAGKDIPALLTSMEQFTKRLGMSLDSIQPGALVPVTQDQGAGGKGTPPAAAPGGAGAKAVPYSKMEVRLSLTGTFDQVVQYLRDLRDFPRLIIVDNVSLAPKQLPRLNVNLTTEIYTLGSTGGTQGGTSPGSAPGRVAPAPTHVAPTGGAPGAAPASTPAPGPRSGAPGPTPGRGAPTTSPGAPAPAHVSDTGPSRVAADPPQLAGGGH
jgi:Tfp pilus assembly protein PilO